MKIEEVVTYKYITEDGQVFLNEQDAIKHENLLIRIRIGKTSKSIGEYSVYTINNQQELNALIFDNDYGERFAMFNKDEIVFPIQVVEEHNEYYYFKYKLLDDLINEVSEKLIQLEDIKK